jgi:hypothetical protein
MAFLVYERAAKGEKHVLRATDQSFSLAGYNLLYAAWERRSRPVEVGWHATSDELIRIRTKNQQSDETQRLIIDFHPSSNRRIGLIELTDVYAFTWGDGTGEPSWTPIMLKIRDLFYEEYDQPIRQEQKTEVIAELDEPGDDAPDSVEFLYLNGPDYGWNWGRNGMTNAAFLHGAARAYFRQFF